MELFQLNSDTKSDSNGKAEIMKVSFKKQIKNDTRNDNFENIISSIGWCNKNEAINLKSNGLSDTGSIFISAVNNFKNIDELYLSTWIISRYNIDMLCSFIDNNKLKKLHFVVSTRLKQLKKSDYSYLVEQFEKRKDKIIYKVCNSHAKVFSFKSKDNYITCIGSGNWTQNPRIETYMIINDKETFEFNKNWMLEIL